MSSYKLSVSPRTDLGRRAKRVFTTGSIPAIVYGGEGTPVAISVDASEFRKTYRQAGTSSLLDLVLEGGEPIKAIIKEIQVFPISMEPYHVDFQRVRMDREMTAEVPLHFVGESKAVKELAGTLSKNLVALHVRCLPANLPHHLEVDISTLASFDDAITVGSFVLPEGVKADMDTTLVIASVTPPLTEEQLKKLEEGSGPSDLSAIKTESEEKKAADAAKKAEEEAAAKS